MLNKTLLSSAAVILAVVGAQAADLPSKKAAPATYVKICDAYGAGFFYIPGTDTCVKLGGYVRAEYNYTPATDTYLLRPTVISAGAVGTGMQAGSGQTANMAAVASTTTSALTNAAATAVVPVAGIIVNNVAMVGGTNPVAVVYNTKDNQDTTGYETRARIDVDARTPTGYGVARTFVRLRAANTSGIRNVNPGNVNGYANSTGSTTGITIEAGMVQWAGFTFGVGPENYAMMPSIMYSGNPWVGFPNGMKQISYTATLGGGWSATLSLEDKQDHAGQASVIESSSNAPAIVGNVRLDQAWGFAAVHGMWVNNSNYKLNNTEADNVSASSGMMSVSGKNTNMNSTDNKSGWAVGTTVNFKLPMIAAGDQIWLTANYADGMIGALLSPGGLSNLATASNHRMIGGLVRVDQNLAVVADSTAAGAMSSLGNVKGWNVAGAMTHYWAAQWRSNISAGYVEINPPTNITNNLVWGKGSIWELAGSIIYSPAKDFDIGLEIQYAKNNNKLQNVTATTANTTDYNNVHGGLSGSNWGTKLRVERAF